MDVRDRRSSNMWRIICALDGIAADARAIAEHSLPSGVGFDIARRAEKASAELENFRARDLINMREVQ